MPIGRSGLNSNNKFVYLMEDAYMENRKKLYSFVRNSLRNKLIIITMNIFVLITIVIFSLITRCFWTISYAIENVIIGIIFIVNTNKTMKNTLVKNDIKHTAGMLFDDNYNILEVNESDVLSNAFKIHELNGMLDEQNKWIDTELFFNIIISVISVVFSVVTDFIAIK